MARRKAITFETAVGEERWKLPPLTPEQILSLPASAEMVYAARSLGLGKTVAYRMCKDLGGLKYGDKILPVPLVNGVYRFLRADLMDLLRIVDPEAVERAAELVRS